MQKSAQELLAIKFQRPEIVKLKGATTHDRKNSAAQLRGVTGLCSCLYALAATASEITLAFDAWVVFYISSRG